MQHGTYRTAGMATVRRLPLYLRELRKREHAGEGYMSGAALARLMTLDPISVRKDLAAMGVPGMPRRGFPVRELIVAIEYFLGWNNASNAFLVGAGNLGQALLGYRGFRRHGLSFVAAFDVHPSVVGCTVSGIRVLHMRELPRLARRMHIQIGVLTVAEEGAQAAAETLVAAGIRGIWNFTAAHLDVPEHVIVHREDLAASLAVLSRRLSIQHLPGKRTT